MFTINDEILMLCALQLAELGLYTTDPNPRVGCVIAQGDTIVGEGWHSKAGEPHAEVYALQAAGERARGATAYVTLEPCNHVGRTPPCTDALIASGVKQVIVASVDPNPRVNGQGIAKLRAAGIEVKTGLCATAAQELNIGFFKRMQHSLPFVRVKSGASLDGRSALANGMSQWITSEDSRLDVHHWRARSSAILTGIGTVIADDPQLNVRAENIDMLGRQPLRVICDSTLQMPPTARVIQGAGAIIYTTVAVKPRGKAEVVRLAADAQSKVDLTAMLRDLAKRGCNEVLVEAGAQLAGRLFELQLVDELLLYLAPVLLGHDARALLQLPPIKNMSERIEFTLQDSQTIGSDLRLRYRPRNS